MSRTFAADYATGTANEHRRLPDVNKFFNTSLAKNNIKFATFDYNTADKAVYAELKTRAIRHDAHPTALIGQNKVYFALNAKKKNPDTKFYFVWEYTDGVYYLEYEEEAWKDFERGDFQRHKRADYDDKPSPVVYVPYKALQRMDI